MSELQQLRFIPFDTVVDTAFWHALAKRKLEDYKLMEGPFPITAEFTSGTAPGLTPRINVDLNSIQDPSNISSQCNNCFRVEGSLFTLNTIDQFKELDKQSFINNFGQEHIVPIVAASKKLPEKSNRLLRFLLLTYCDLKHHKFYFWFAFPSPLQQQGFHILNRKPILEEFSQPQLDNLLASYDKWRENSKDVFFSFRVEADGDARVFSLSEFDASQENNYLGFSDPSSDTDHPGWPLRNLLFATSSTLTSPFPETVKVLCFRDRYAHGKRIFSHSFVLRISLLQKPSPSETKFVGWEKWQGKLQPQRVNLSSTMDPIKLAESAVDLNLKLMVWRMLPDLDLATLGKTKCLILGAGTLGCNVAQQLLAWGFRKMTLVDNASVSYSNPVRQTLYTFEDAKAGIKKAEAAAAGLKRIHPCVEVFGVELTIPMPGHAISSISVPTDAALQPQVVAARKACEQLDELICTHDVVFLLLDTREARWLPTMLATYHSKIAITAALGFDSYLVMRHGLPRSPGTSPSQPSNQETASKAPGDGGLRQLSGSQLGCYFCNDVVGPANVSLACPSISPVSSSRCETVLSISSALSLDREHR
uniref:Ubiquitin-like modifier-activating enzyme ATG7 n=1 Tax=Schistocephalus solidus TaxID=70667 RepID=A0A0X3NLP3_SCHSO